MQISASEISDIINSEAQDDASLIAVLEAVQARYRYLPPEALILACERLGLPLSQAYSVATFYHAFSLKPKGKHCLHVCMGTACFVKGADKVLERLKELLGVEPGQTTADGMFTLESARCLGACALAPIVVIDGKTYGNMEPSGVEKMLGEHGFTKKAEKRVMPAPI